MAKYCQMCDAHTNCTDNCSSCMAEEIKEPTEACKVEFSLKDLIEEKVDEIFLAYQNAYNITNGDIEPMDAFKLDMITKMLEEHIKYVCEKQMWRGYNDI